LPDEVVYKPDVKAKVRAIETVDREFVGPFLQGLAKLGSHRLVMISDPGAVYEGNVAEGHCLYAYHDSASNPGSDDGRRFTESDAQASATTPRDATKFVVRLFAKGS
jgi:2,3-bisphosphoglycerate-independent phosphoglycerate mutase